MQLKGGLDFFFFFFWTDLIFAAVFSFRLRTTSIHKDKPPRMFTVARFNRTTKKRTQKSSNRSVNQIMGSTIQPLKNHIVGGAGVA